MSIANLAYVDATGFHYADYPTVLSYFKDSYRSIYGADVYLESDSQDGEWLAIVAQAVYDSIALAAATYNSFSPSTAQTDALSRDVKINGIARKIPSQSTVDLYIVGEAGTEITNGLAEDTSAIKWALPASVIIPPSGDITVTATAQTTGSVQAPINTVTKIGTPTRGWQTVTNLVSASPGAPVESDAELRLRQSQSVALPSRTVREGIVGAIANLTGVTRLRVYENDTDTTDADGIPEHSIAAVVEGGDSTDIAQTIAVKKTPGGFTFGSVSTVVTDTYGMPITIRFGRPVYDTITTAITIKALTGYTATTGDAIKAAIADYQNSVEIGGGLGKSVEWGDAIAAANSVGGGVTYKIVSLAMTGPGGAGTPDVPLAYNHAAQAVPANVTLTVI
ncbi:Baseplate J-like protein [compost metagenome]